MDFERRERELAKKEEERRKQQLDDIRTAEILKQETYHRSMVDWETAAKKVKDQRRQRINEALAVEEASLRENYLQTRYATISTLEEEKAEVERQYASVNTQLTSAGFFNFAKKKQLKATLEALKKKRASIHESIKNAGNDYERALAKLSNVLEKKKASISAAVEKALPIPTATYRTGPSLQKRNIIQG